MSRHFWAIVFCLFGISVLSAQSVDKTVSRALSEYFKSYTSPRTQFKYSALDRRRNNIVVNNNAKKVVIYANEAFAGQAFTPEVVDKVYDDVRAILPKKLRKYKIEVVYKGRAIEERIPHIYRSAKQSKECKGKDYNTCIYRQSQLVYEEYIDHSTEVDGVRDDDAVQDEQNGTRQECYKCHTLQCDVAILAEVVDKYQCRNGEQVEDVYTNRKSHQIGDKHYPTR